MRKKHLIHFCILSCMILFWNCTDKNDYEVLTNDYNQNLIDSQIFELLECNKKIFSESNLSLKKILDINSISISIDMFLNDDYDCFPIYNIDLKKFNLVDWTFFKKDTVLVHLKYSYIEKYLDSLLLTNKENFIAKELTWQSDGKEFKTLSLFNKFTGELEYDNVLFNTFQTSYSSSSLKHILTRGEGGIGETNFIYYTIGNITADGTMSWYITGEYHNIITAISGNDTTYSRIYVADMPIIDTQFNIPNNFPERDWVITIGNVETNYSPSPYFRTYYTVSMGIGYPGLSIPIPIQYETFYRTEYYGFGYSYKKYIN